jgi:hypothetical protein
MPRPGHFTPEKEPVPIVEEVRWAPGPVWRGAENLASSGIGSPDVQSVASRYADYAIPAPGLGQNYSETGFAPDYYYYNYNNNNNYYYHRVITFMQGI